jgi:hypothetical protein
MFKRSKESLEKALPHYEKMSHTSGMAYCHTLLFHLKKKLGQNVSLTPV